MKRTLFFLFLGFLHYWNISLTHAQSTSEPIDHESETVILTRGPYLQSLSPTGITIRWRTNIPVLSKVVYGEDLKILDHTSQLNKETLEHEVRLNDLSPYTKYYYRVYLSDDVHIEADSSYYFITSPEKDTDQPVRIWALGDFGLGNDIARQVKESYFNHSKGEHTDVWLMLGDIAYNSGTEAEFQRALFNNVYDEFLRNTVAWPTPGNHDCRSADSKIESGPYYEIFSLSVDGESGGYPSKTEAYYSFDYGNIHFISLDSEECPRDKDGEMANWLIEDLKTNQSEWLIVFFHHPPYTKGTHDSDHKRDSRRRMIEMRENFLPIIESYNADLVLSGHSHVYERSHLIHGHYGFSDSFAPKQMIIAKPKKKKGVFTYIKNEQSNGTMYIVCGVGSHKPQHAPLNHPVMSIGMNEYPGSLSIEIYDNRLQGRFIDMNGKVRDNFAITKEKLSGNDEIGLIE